MKAILIIRVSTDKQEYEEQKQDLIAYGIKKGYKKKDLIPIDAIESAITNEEKDRKSLTLLKEYIDNDKSINAIFLWELSRLARTMEVGISIRDFLIKNKIQLYCLNPSITLLNDKLKATSEGKMSFSIFLQLSENEMDLKKARFHRSKIRNAKSGKYSGGFIKFGYYVDDNGYYKIKKEEADLVKEIFNRYEQGISIFKLTQEYLERGKIPSSSFVAETLKCEAYIGLSNKYGMNRVYPQIISKEQFQRCRKIAKENNKKADKANEVYMAYKLIKCVECGGTYIGMKSTIQYLCYNRYGKESRIKRELAKKNPEKANEILTEVCKDSIGININILDTVLWNACKGLEVIYRTQNLKQMQDELNDKIIANNEKIAKCKKDIIDEQNEMDRINILFQKGRISEKASDENYNTCLKNIKGHNNKISDLESTNLLYTEKIKELSNTSTTIEDIRKLHEGLYASDDVIEKQEIIKRHVNYINIISETPNKTKLIKIYFHVFKNPMVYRIHYKKKPQIIEYDVRGAYAEPPYQFSKVGFEIVKRFITKNGKTVTVN
jgi:DNA invertase Pin-like site-specific DNA recombinase